MAHTVCKKCEHTIHTEECDEVDDVEALELEHGDDGGEGVVWCRDVVVGALDAGAPSVPPPQRHDPPGPASLQFVQPSIVVLRVNLIDGDFGEAASDAK